MKQQQRREYSALFAAQSKRIERKFLPIVFNALEPQVNQALKVIKSMGPAMARGQIDLVILNDKIEPVLQDLHVYSGLFFANKGLRDVNKSVRLRTKAAPFGYNEEWSESIIAYFRKFLLEKSVFPVTQTTKEQILKVLEQAEREGWGYDRIAAELQDPQLLLWRARRIVRTENLMASNYGLKLAADKSPFETSEEWIAANDHRTRYSHRDVDGDTVESGQKFVVPIYRGKAQIGTEMMTGPGDPEASAGNIINCRCTKALTATLNERGKLISKQQTVSV